MGKGRTPLIAGIFALMLLVIPAQAQDFYTGLAAALRGDYATALQEWRPLAEQGDAKAQFNLGVMYNNGEGVAQDYITAHVWFNIAAAIGNTEVSKSASENRDIAASKLSADALIEAQRLARQCLDSTYQNCP